MAKVDIIVSLLRLLKYHLLVLIILIDNLFVSSLKYERIVVPKRTKYNTSKAAFGIFDTRSSVPRC